MRTRTRTMRTGVAALGVLSLIAIAVPAVALDPPFTERVSVDSGEGGGRELPAMSADGSRVIFVGRGESNQGVWMRDRNAGVTYRLTTGSHFNPAISGDGNTVAYVEYGTNRSVWVIDVTDPASPGAPERADVSSTGAPGNALSDFPSLDGDGSLVAFQSTASNLDPGTPPPASGGPNKVYVRDRVAEETFMVSVDATGTALPGNAIKPDLTSDGTYVTFASEQVLDLPPAPVATMARPAAPPDDHGGDEGEEEETETFQQVYVREVADASTVEVVSISSDGVLGDAGSSLVYGPTISDDGMRIAFESDATNLVADDLNRVTDAFVHDRATGETVSVSAYEADPEYGPFVPVTPVRLLDTRFTAPVGAGATVTIDVAGQAGVPETASAVALNVTAVAPTAAGFLTIFPSGTTRPLASSVNFVAGDVNPNAVTARLGDDGSLSIYNSAGATHVVIDLNGYYDDTMTIGTSGGGGFVPSAPQRLVDTRTTAIVPAGGTLDVQVTGVAGVPATAIAAALNVTAVNPSAAGHFTVYPTGSPVPLASNLNFVAGDVVANSVMAKIGADGKVSIYNFGGTAHVVVDLNGYFDGAALDGGLTAVVPARLVDTRDGLGTLGQGETLEVKFTGVGGVPDDGTVTAVVFNLTGVSPTAATVLTAYPTGTALPLASNLNLVKGEVRPNQVVAAVGTDGKVSIFNAWGEVHVVVDVMAYFTDVPVPAAGNGPAITGDGTAVAFESMAALTPDDLNGVKDAYLRILDGMVLERVSVVSEGTDGTEATGTRVDGHTGEVVPVVNGADVNVGATAAHIAFVSNGDLAGERPVGEETPDEVSTEPASYVRTRS